ncbi:Vacuolar protein sorting-associated protein 35 [Lobosporangium transversale]|uniref:Vacuolar protein sorting-associated protein 35 n=1 Tax=Lobosporangium transversale TaxID=64571 RepID=A0A1Y2GTN4_9FUNG|nr:vacuolar protein sorting-associated protein 35 [Lobosporangium transversale]KAF9906407.1 Vacuolar protein sorting-associated protein 35 [Lobosporangium transversale]ORZ22850.1 vacuolar protein sorting-associated protein 35 [Lobosporangium transversale]|eukprot:XP_021883404.1 vacuolar protein sorting-associated protein 35 [Lobosporangium transversale]
MASTAPSTEDQAKFLEDALNVVKIQSFQMKRCLGNNKLMDGLKHCSTMLAELRTSNLTPKNYYELYMAIFDALRHVTTYLKEAHQSGRHHLADLYELVQYAGNIVPRLYLMVTVGSVYMEMPDAPVKEIMRDMMEMARGVQHPTRGLFLRYYLSGQTRNALPVGTEDGPEGSITDSIQFILTNFIEMNKLWVRLQHQGHSREREKREMERKELRILVGTNLVRLSQLDNVDLEVYQSTILPSVLEQIKSCKDVIAQEYLMEVIIQVFPDDFHLRTLKPLLSATAPLQPKVNVKQIVIALIDRLAAHAAREADSNDDVAISETPASPKAPSVKAIEESTEKEEPSANGDNSEEAKEGLGEKAMVRYEGLGEKAIVRYEDEETVAGEEDPEQQQEQPASAPKPVKVRRIRGIPEDVELFEIFWDKIVELVKRRPELSIQDITALLVSLINLSLSCYPENLKYAGQVLGFAKDKASEYSESPELQHKDTVSNLQNLLTAPIQHYPSILTLLELPNFIALLSLQPYQTRRAIAHAVVESILKNETIISTPEDVNGILEICAVMVRDQKDGGHNSGPFRSTRSNRNESGNVDPEEFAEEQGHLARIIHLFRSEDADTQAAILSAARKQFGDGGERIRYMFPPLVIQAVKLARRFKRLQDTDEGWEKKCSTLFRFINQVISILHSKVDNSDVVLRLFLLAGQSADECGFEDICYEFFVQAFTIYEESISESRAQFQAITLMVGTLQTTSCFNVDHYDTLITKCALHGAKLLKKPDQCRAVYTCSHLWWGTMIVGQSEEGEEAVQPYRDGKRVLECLQKALKIADSCMDSVTNVELFVEILNRYIYYFEKQNEAVTVKYLNGLIDLINTNLGNMENPDQHPPSTNSSALLENDPAHLSEYVLAHFRNTIYHLERRKNAGDKKYADLDASLAI